jgi:hypothetical protein
MEKKILKCDPLTTEEIMKHPKGWRYGNYQLHKRLYNLSIQQDYDELKRLHAIWLEYLICYYNNLCNARDVSPDIRTIDAVNIFIELSRVHYRVVEQNINKDRLEYENALFTLHYNQNMFVYALKHSDYEQTRLDWNKPIMQYNQQDIIDALLMLTENIDRISCSQSSIDETKKILELLYTRNSMFICVPWEKDDPIFNVKGFIHENGLFPNRDYFTFTTIYFHSIQRRIFYNDLFIQHTDKKPVLPEGAILRCREWVEQVLCGNLEDEVFEKIYAESCDEAYVFPGDYEWYIYRYPDLPNHQIAPILECFRKEYAKKYFSEYRISLQTILASINANSHTGHCARLFLINLIDAYMKNNLDFKWKDIVIISNEMLEGATEEIIRDEGETPYLVQTFSRYCLYNDSGVYICDDFYETLTYWFFIIKERGKKHRFTKLIEKIIDNVKQKPSYSGTF